MQGQVVLQGVHCSTKYGSLARGLKPPAAGYSDMEDCIVCQPDRDYRQLMSRKYRYRARSHEEEGE